MQFSQTILERAKNPHFLNLSKFPLDHQVEIDLIKLGIKLEVFFKTTKKEELILEMANFYTDYKGEYLGVIDGFFALIQNKAIEGVDRFPIKELDYFLRDSNDKSAFSGYSQEIYEVLSIGECLKNHIYGKKNLGFQYDPDIDGEFFELSTSEQYELLEEFFAYYIYPNPEFPDEVEVLDITEGEIKLSVDDDRIQSLILELILTSS